MSKANIQVSIDNGRLMTKLAAVGLIFSVCFLILTAVIGSLRGGDVFRFGMITYALSAVFSFGALIYGMLSTQAGLENEEKQLPSNCLRSSSRFVVGGSALCAREW